MKLEGIRPFVKHPDYPETFPAQNPLLDLVDSAMWMSVMRPFLDRVKTHHWHWGVYNQLPAEFGEHALRIPEDPVAKYGGEQFLATVFGHINDWQEALVTQPKDQDIVYRYGFATQRMIDQKVLHLCHLLIPAGERISFLRGNQPFYATLVSNDFRSLAMTDPQYMLRKDIPSSIHIL